MNKSIITLACCLASLSLAAQNKINPVIEVERLYQADLMDVSKPLLNTTIPDSLRTYNTSIRYFIFDKPLSGLYEFTPLPGAVLSPETELRKQYGYVRLGLGYPLTPQGDLLLQTPLGKHTFIGANTRHRSFWGELPVNGSDVKQDRMVNTGNIRLEHHSKLNVQYMETDFENRYHLFAMPNDSQMYYAGGGHLGLYSSDTTRSEWNYALDLGYRHAQNNLNLNAIENNIRENKLDIYALAGYNVNTAFSVNLEGKVRFISNRWTTDGTSASQGTASLLPHIVWSGERFLVSAGGRISLLMESADKNTFMLMPWAKMHFHLVPDNLVVYAQIDGSQEVNSYQERIRENPWLINPTDTTALLPYTPLTAEAGFTGTIGDRFTYKAYASYRFTRRQFYYQDAYDILSPYFACGRYGLFYDDETRYGIGGSLGYQNKAFEGYVSANWYKYTLENYSVPNYMPTFEAKIHLRYNWRERIIAQIESQYRSMVSSFVEGDLPSYTNLNAQVEYIWTRHFSVFAYGNNLLNQNIWIYHYYQQPGRQIGAGLTIRF